MGGWSRLKLLRPTLRRWAIIRLRSKNLKLYTPGHFTLAVPSTQLAGMNGGGSSPTQTGLQLFPNYSGKIFDFDCHVPLWAAQESQNPWRLKGISLLVGTGKEFSGSGNTVGETGNF